ncbi:uncharacterized protein TRAVEDRAFT_75231 [Trametes versicolor FP-101664 SS1]|uniref:uncharacterized protein n=1 Tax=Trametes versicolor (strain FP-101664) TaxID=717944 RepID=UPI0004623D21|nr:uncharacterized protein TRAVEDRAFT_75231 [Trametes versicolor FP-101664 SS1]EIW53085.1 hypothetical protein TRAVEDRAFT_75231 [Trametes versicolor FP-101664 SS1]
MDIATSAFTEAASPTPDLGATFGITLIGTCVGLMLYGMTIHQTYRYLRMYTSDKGILKTTVRILFLADTIHSMLSVHICYYYLIQSQADHSMLLNGVWSIRSIGLVTQLVVTIVQGFYLRRIRIIGAHVVVQAVVAMLMLGEIVSNLVMTVALFETVSLATWAKSAWLAAVPYGFTIVTDVILTSTLILFLHRSRTGMRQTDTLLNTLIAYTINTGLLTTSLSTLCLFFTIRQPYNLIYFALNMPITKSYTNSMLTVLNSRHALADRACATTGDLGTFGMAASPSVRLSHLPSSRNVPSISFRRMSTDDSGFEC